MLLEWLNEETYELVSSCFVVVMKKNKQIQLNLEKQVFVSDEFR